MIIYTTATGADYRLLAAQQRDSLRAHGYTGRWRCLTDAPEEFGAEGLPADPGAELHRTINRRQKTRLLDLCEVEPRETVVFLEADVMACAPLAPLWAELERPERVLVQRGYAQLASMLKAQRGMEIGEEAPAPWCGMVAIPAAPRAGFFAGWQQAHAAAVLGYDELALLDALAPFPWGFSECVAFAGERPAPLLHYQGALKVDLSPSMAAGVRARQVQLLALVRGRSGASTRRIRLARLAPSPAMEGVRP